MGPGEWRDRLRPGRLPVQLSWLRSTGDVDRYERRHVLPVGHAARFKIYGDDIVAYSNLRTQQSFGLVSVRHAYARRWFLFSFLVGEVRIDRDALTSIVAHARRDAPNECCGLLVGRAGEILEAIPASNGAPDPAKRYEISPVDYFAQIHRCRRINEAQSENFAVVGAYHSHPRGGPEPSETDIAQAFRDFVFLIVGLGGTAGGMQIGAYTLNDETLRPVQLTVVD